MQIIVKSLALTFAALFFAACSNPADQAPKGEVAEPEAAPQEAPAEEVDAAQFETLAFGPESSRVEWVGSKVTGKHDGGFKDFSGEIKLNPESLESSQVNFTVQMASVFCDTEKLTAHLKTDDFFAVEKFPTATFTSTKLENYEAPAAEATAKPAAAKGEKPAGEKAKWEPTHTVTGNLTLRGVTKAITFPAAIQVTNDKVSVKSKFSLNRQDFDVKYAGMPDDLIRDDVLIKLKLKAERKGTM